MTGQEARDDEREARIREARTWPRDGVNEGALIHALADEVERLARKHAETEWEYGAGYEADNGIEMRWFSMGGAAYTVREAAESEVARFADPQIQLVRRTRPGPWVPVGEGDQR